MSGTNDIGEVNGEDGKEHHTSQGQENRDDFAHWGDGLDATPCGSGGHAWVPKAVPKVVYHGIGVDLEHIEYQATVIYKGEEYYDVGDEQACREVAHESVGNDSEGYIAADEGDEAKEKLHLWREGYTTPVKDGEIGYDEQQEEDMTPKVVPWSIGIAHLEHKQYDEQHTYPKLEVKVAGIIIEGDALEGIYGDTDDKQQAEHEGREVQGELNAGFREHAERKLGLLIGCGYKLTHRHKERLRHDVLNLLCHYTLTSTIAH